MIEGLCLQLLTVINSESMGLSFSGTRHISTFVDVFGDFIITFNTFKDAFIKFISPSLTNTKPLYTGGRACKNIVTNVWVNN